MIVEFNYNEILNKINFENICILSRLINNMDNDLLDKLIEVFQGKDKNAFVDLLTVEKNKYNIYIFDKDTNLDTELKYGTKSIFGKKLVETSNQLIKNEYELISNVEESLKLLFKRIDHTINVKGMENEINILDLIKKYYKPITTDNFNYSRSIYERYLISLDSLNFDKETILIINDMFDLMNFSQKRNLLNKINDLPNTKAIIFSEDINTLFYYSNYYKVYYYFKSFLSHEFVIESIINDFVSINNLSESMHNGKIIHNFINENPNIFFSIILDNNPEELIYFLKNTGIVSGSNMVLAEKIKNWININS